MRAAASVRLCRSAHLLAGPSWPSLCASRGGFPGTGGAAAVGPQSAGHEHLLSGDLFLCLSIFLLHSITSLAVASCCLFGREQRNGLSVIYLSLLLLCSLVASNFSSSGSSFLFPCPASHGCAVAICSDFLLGLCCHLQVASYLVQSVIFHMSWLTAASSSPYFVAAAVCLLVSTILCHISIHVHPYHLLVVLLAA